MNHDEKKDWLNNLKEGDRVLVRNRIISKETTITRITKTRRIITDAGYKFNANGTEYAPQYKGYQWGQNNIEPITDLYRQELEMKRMIYKIKDVNWNLVNYDNLKIIVSILGIEETEET